MKIDGACHCGAVAYEAVLQSPDIRLCHCSDCQSLSGSPYRATATARLADFRLLRGTPSLYMKTGDSGRTSEQHFCGTCGAPLFRTAPDDDTVGIRIGTIRQRASLSPALQIFCSSALAWSGNLAGIPALPKESA